MCPEGKERNSQSLAVNRQKKKPWRRSPLDGEKKKKRPVGGRKGKKKATNCYTRTICDPGRGGGERAKEESRAVFSARERKEKDQQRPASSIGQPAPEGTGHVGREKEGKKKKTCLRGNGRKKKKNKTPLPKKKKIEIGEISREGGGKGGKIVILSDYWEKKKCKKYCNYAFL